MIPKLLVVLMFVTGGLMAFAHIRIEATRESAVQSRAEIEAEIASLRAWATSHDRTDQERYKDLELLKSIARANAETNVKQDGQITNLSGRLDDFIWWFRAVFGAVLVQLAATLFRILDAAKTQKMAREEASRSHRKSV